MEQPIQVALVTGASRGIGRGVAQVLSDAGATVYATGRSIADAQLPDRVIRLRCDHTDDEQVARVFDRILDDTGRLDLLVNGVWGGYEQMMEHGQFTWPKPFWEQPLWRWDAMMTAGVRAGYVASHHAARLMVPQRRGLIVHLSHWAAQKHQSNVAYGVSKAATDKMTAHMAHELRSMDRNRIRDREEWVTKFVNTILREMRRGLDRMAVVAAARNEWPQLQGSDPRLAAQEWVRRAAPSQH